MKKYLALIAIVSLFGFAPSAFALNANDLRLTQRAPDNLGNIIRDLPLPDGSANAVVGINGTSTLPQYFLLGPGLSFDGSVLNASLSAGIADISGLQGALDAKIASSSLAAVATSGDYNDLINKPATSSSTPQVNSDWNAVSGVAQILNKPSLSAVAISGAYADLTGKPSLSFDVLGQATSSAAAAQAFAIQRSNHTGTQPASTITGLAAVATTSSYADLTNKPLIGVAYEGTTQRTGSFPIFKSATVGSGVAVFNLTNDGTSGGTALCTNGVIQDSVNVGVNDSAASYQMSWAFTNSNKTLTVTTNKLSTANILTGVLGQVAGNGSVVKLTVWCY